MAESEHGSRRHPWDGLIAWGKRVIARVLATRPARAFLLYQKHHGAMLADSVTYRALFSVFAGVFLGFAIAGIWLAGNDEAMNALVKTLDDAIPGLVGEGGFIDPDELIQPLTLSITGVIALVGLVGTAIGAIGSLRTAFRQLADQPDETTFFLWVLARDLLLAIGFGVMLAAAAMLTFFSASALRWLFGAVGASTATQLYDGTVQAVSLVVIFAIDTLLIAIMFRALSGVKPSSRSLWIGAVIGGIGLTVLQQLSSLFVSGATSNPLLASVGTLIALLLWFNLSSQVILLAGAYIVIGERPPVTPAPPRP